MREILFEYYPIGITCAAKISVNTGIPMEALIGKVEEPARPTFEQFRLTNECRKCYLAGHKEQITEEMRSAQRAVSGYYLQRNRVKMMKRVDRMRIQMMKEDDRNENR